MQWPAATDVSHPSLRCFDQMSYADIAEMMGCKIAGAGAVLSGQPLAEPAVAPPGPAGPAANGARPVQVTAPADSASAGTVTAASPHVGLVPLVGRRGTPSGMHAVTVAGATLTLTLEHFVYFTLLLYRPRSRSSSASI
jgi:hypothetical protein